MLYYINGCHWFDHRLYKATGSLTLRRSPTYLIHLSIPLALPPTIIATSYNQMIPRHLIQNSKLKIQNCFSSFDSLISSVKVQDTPPLAIVDMFTAR